jgi:molybdate transport system substrate-binding protein
MTLRILSAGAVKPGLLKVVDAFEGDMANDVRLSFATAPAIFERIRDGASFDIVIAPPNVLDELIGARDGRPGERVPLGRIGVGAMVEGGAKLPAINSVAQFTDTLHGAETLIYNQASTGIYLDALFARLGIAEKLASKTIRYPDFAAVLRHVRNAHDRALGLGATTVIAESDGVKFAGPLPEEIQNYTHYESMVLPGAESNNAAEEFMRYLTLPKVKQQLAAAGIG